MLAVLSALSVTVHITVVSPMEKTEGASFVIFLISQLSPVVGVPRLTLDAVHSLLSVSTVTSAGAEIVGFSLSSTTTSI